MGREDPGTSDSTVGQDAVTQGKRHEGISLVCLNVTRSQSVRGGKQGDFWQGIVSSHWCTCSPGWGAHILCGYAEAAEKYEALKFIPQ